MTTTDPSQSAVALRPFNESDFASFAELLANLWHSESDRGLSLLQGSEELSHHCRKRPGALLLSNQNHSACAL